MNREQAKHYVSFIVDDAGSATSPGETPHSTIREQGTEFKHASRLVGWQCGFEPLFVAVHSCLDVELTSDEAEDIAAEYLDEKDWFGHQAKLNADYIL